MMQEDSQITISTVCSSISLSQQGSYDGIKGSRSDALPLLFQHIKKADWKKLRTDLSSQCCFALCQERDATELSCLAMALVTRTPIDIVKRMIEIDPNLLYQQDVYGATPLHVACLNGTTVESLEAILKCDEQNITLRGSKNEGLASLLDSDRRSALHHAVEYACANAQNTIKNTNKTPVFLFCWSNEEISRPEKTRTAVTRIHQAYSLRMIKMICEASPKMVFVKCESGLTPVDILHIHRGNLYIKTQTEDSAEYRFLSEIYSILKRTSIQQYKKQKLLWETENKHGSSCTSSRSRRRASLSEESSRECIQMAL